MRRGKREERTVTRRQQKSEDNPGLKPESPDFAQKFFKTQENLAIPTRLCTEMLEALESGALNQNKISMSSLQL